MYPVSNYYKQSMKQQIRNTFKTTVDLYTVIPQIQSELRIFSTTGIHGVDNYNTEAFGRKPFEIKSYRMPMSFDNNYMFANGEYYKEENQVFMTEDLSGTVKNATFGDYEFTTHPILNISDYKTPHFNVEDLGYTLLTEGISRLKVTLENDAEPGFNKIYEFAIKNNEDIHINTDNYCYAEYNNIVIEIIASHQPQHRAKIIKILFGTHMRLTDKEIISLDYEDENDCVCLEIPIKKLKLTMDNGIGKYSQEQELIKPQFLKYYTQAITSIFYDTTNNETFEPVEIGRLFMENYKVESNTLTFDFTSALGLLDNYLHKWCEAFDLSSPKSRFDEVINLDTNNPVENELWDIESGELYYLKSAGQLYGIDYFTDLSEALQEIADVPLVPQSQALQLIANRFNKLLRAGRKTDLECISRDNTVKSSIESSEMFSFPTLEKTKRISHIEVEVRDFQFTPAQGNTPQSNYKEEKNKLCNVEIKSTPTEVLNDNMIVRYTVNSPGSPNAVSLLNSTQYAYRTRVYLHSAYFQSQSGGYYPGVENEPSGIYNINFWEYTFNSTKVKIKFDKSGETLSVSNPMFIRSFPINLQGTEKWTKPTLPQEVAAPLYNELKNNITAEIQHRGFPELDCGDVIEFELKDMPKQKGRVIGNKFNITTGAMSGSTKVRWLYAGV
ncbi:MAG: hypothetical protein RSF40_07365 [Oscillospiraceae bacterium]